MAILDAMGCRHGQGFLYSKAVPPEQAAALLGVAVSAC